MGGIKHPAKGTEMAALYNRKIGSLSKILQRSSFKKKKTEAKQISLYQSCHHKESVQTRERT